MRNSTLCLGVLTLLCSVEVVFAAAPLPEVARAQFTTHMKKNSEPADKIVLLGNSVKEIFYFTELRNLTGKTVRHRWEFKGDVVAEFPIKVTGPRARVFSRMSLEGKKLGKWTALVVDQRGWVLKATQFEYVPAELAR
jgi:hypothetical protein